MNSLKSVLINLRLFFDTFRCLPHLVLMMLHKDRKLIREDVKRWLECSKLDYSIPFGFIYLLSFYPEFRNLFYHRVGLIGKVLNVVCPKMSTLFIASNNIGEGLFIQHGFATYIAARSIGTNCWINQQVTIGYSSSDCPVLGDNVTINAGAKVIGNITIGSNSIVGANAVVVKDVPANCVVVGVPAQIVRRDGVRVNQKL